MFIYSAVFFMGMAFISFECAKKLPNKLFANISQDLIDIEKLILKHPILTVAITVITMTVTLVAIGYVIEFGLFQVLYTVLMLGVAFVVLKTLLQEGTSLSTQTSILVSASLVSFLGVTHILQPSWVVSNVIAILVAGFVIRLLSSIPLKLILVFFIATFIYDVINVYGTGFMVQTATAMIATEIPGPILRAPSSFSVLALRDNTGLILGAGDIIIPGIIVLKGMLAGYKVPMVHAYMVGLALAFYVNYLTQMPVPALITLVPITLVTYFACVRVEAYRLTRIG